MKGKQLAILLALVVVLGGLGWYLQTGNRSSWSSTAAGSGGKVLTLPINDVAQITIQAADGSVNLTKKNDAWVIAERADYPAEFTKVSDLLRVSWDLKTLQEVKVGPSQLGRLELLEPGKGAGSATLLDFKDKDGKRLTALLLGKVLRTAGDPAMAQFGESGFARGRYVKPAAEGAKVSLVSETFERADTKPEKWLQQTFFHAENLKSVAVAGTTDAQKWKLRREAPGGEWTLEGAKPEEKVDGGKVSALNFTYSNPSFVDVLPATAKPEDTGLDKPTTATLETSDGLTYTLKVGKPSGENYPMMLAVEGNFPKERTPGKDEKPEDKAKLDEEFKATLKKSEDKLAAEKKLEGPIYLVAKATVEPLLKDRAALLAEKASATPAPGAASAPPAGPGSPAATSTNDVLEKLRKALPPGTSISADKPATPAPSVATPPVAAPNPAPPESPQ